MMKFTTVYPFNVEDEIKAGHDVSMLDKSNGTTHNVNTLAYAKVMRALDNKEDRYYFWKFEWVDNTEEPQATENEE